MRIETNVLVTIATPDPSATAPLAEETPASTTASASSCAGSSPEHDTQRLPALTWRQSVALAYRIGRDRLARGGPWLAAGVVAALVALAALLVFGPAPAAQALVLARPTAATVLMTATPSLMEALPTPPLPTAEPAPAAPIIVVEAPLPTAEPAPADLQPAPIIIVAQAPLPTPSDLQPIIIPAGDGGQWSVVDHGNGTTESTYIPPPGATPAPTPYYGAMNGGGGSWDD